LDFENSSSIKNSPDNETPNASDLKSTFYSGTRYFICFCYLKNYFSDIFPINTDNWTDTQKFLLSIVHVLLKYIKESNDRKTKLVEFHHPNELREILDLKIYDNPRDLESLINDCATVLKFQVKTGEKTQLIKWNIFNNLPLFQVIHIFSIKFLVVWIWFPWPVSGWQRRQIQTCKLCIYHNFYI